MIAFAKVFNSEKFSRDPEYVSGSGAYKFKSWATGQRIVLEKKANWWGDALKTNNCFFEANPSKLIYQTINDMTSALVSLKAGNIDVIANIKPSDFGELPKSEKFAKDFNTYRTLKLAYSYIGLNMANPKFADIRTRKAIAHLIDVPRVIKDVFYGYARQVTSAITPMDSVEYDYSMKPYELNDRYCKNIVSCCRLER